jgi:hypothetical protein
LPAVGTQGLGEPAGARVTTGVHKCLGCSMVPAHVSHVLAVLHLSFGHAVLSLWGNTSRSIRFCTIQSCFLHVLNNSDSDCYPCCCRCCCLGPCCFPPTDKSGYLIGSIEGRVAVHHVEEANQSKNFTFKCHRLGLRKNGCCSCFCVQLAIYAAAAAAGCRCL